MGKRGRYDLATIARGRGNSPTFGEFLAILPDKIVHYAMEQDGICFQPVNK
jgi:hypothetical protein